MCVYLCVLLTLLLVNCINVVFLLSPFISGGVNPGPPRQLSHTIKKKKKKKATRTAAKNVIERQRVLTIYIYTRGNLYGCHNSVSRVCATHTHTPAVSFFFFFFFFGMLVSSRVAQKPGRDTNEAFPCHITFVLLFFFFSEVYTPHHFARNKNNQNMYIDLTHDALVCACHLSPPPPFCPDFLFNSGKGGQFKKENVGELFGSL